MTEIPEGLTWSKSSFSGGQGGSCVEVAALPDGGTAVRHSKHIDGPAIAYTAAEWAAFLAGVKAGEFDH